MQVDRFLWLTLSVMLLSSCAARRSGQPLSEFPTAPRLRELATQHHKPTPNLPAFATWESWRVTSETSDTLGSVGTLVDAPWNKLLTELAAGTGATPTQAMSCVAAELARLEIAGHGVADAALQRFLLARCGAIEGALQSLTLNQTIQTGLSDAEAFAQLAPQLREALHDALRDGPRKVGLGFAQSDGKTAVVLARASSEVDLQPSSRIIGPDSTVVLEGRIQEPADAISGLINDGKFGVRSCEVDPSLALPAFRVRCKAAAQDEAAWISLSIVPTRRVLAKCVLNVLAIRMSDAERTREREVEEASPVRDEASFPAAAMVVINRARSKAGLGPVSQAEQQSKVVTQLVEPLWLTSLEESDDAIEASNEITLGLMAGWDVKGGLIEDADFVLDYQGGPPDAARWLADTLEHPMGRKVLLAPNADMLAIGAHMPSKPDMLAVVAVNYTFHKAEPSLQARSEELVERLARTRKARNLGKTRFVTDLPGVGDAIRTISSAEATPADAMRVVMQKVSEFSGKPVRGLVWETHDLNEIEFPSELLRYGDLTLGAGVTFYRPPGGAWGQYAVIFVMLDEPEQGEL